MEEYMSRWLDRMDGWIEWMNEWIGGWVIDEGESCYSILYYDISIIYSIA